MQQAAIDPTLDRCTRYPLRLGGLMQYGIQSLLYGSENLDLTVNKRIVTETLRFIKDSKRFDP